MPRFSGENFDANQAIVDDVTAVAQAHGALPGQVALAWVIAQGDDVVPIPGTKRHDVPRAERRRRRPGLTEDELARLDSVADLVAGPR